MVSNDGPPHISRSGWAALNGQHLRKSAGNCYHGSPLVRGRQWQVNAAWMKLSVSSYPQLKAFQNLIQGKSVIAYEFNNGESAWKLFSLLDNGHLGNICNPKSVRVVRRLLV